MTGYRELLEKEIVEAWRTYRIVIVCALFAVIGIVTPVLVRNLPDLFAMFAPPDFELGLEEMGLPDVVDQLLRSVSQLGALAAILLTMGSVAGEKERRTAALVLTKPVSRFAFLMAKLVSIAMVLALATGLGILAAWLYTSLLFEQPPVMPWLQLALLIWLSIMVFAAITFLGSTLVRSTLGAAAIGLAGLIALSLASTISTVATWLPTGLVDVARSIALEEESPDLDPSRTIAISIAVIVGCLLLAWLRFRREEV
jgi:ABC-2 type transport system permease protein